MSVVATQPRRCAFTLVELLVVIGIIALLIAILLPALSRAKESARTVQCLSTCRTMSQAAVIHANDHLNYYPIAGAEHNLTGGVCNPAGLDDAGMRKYTYYLDDKGVTRPAPMSVALALSLKVKVRTTDPTSMQTDMQTAGFRRLFACTSQENVPLGATQRGDDGFNAPGEYLSYIFNEAFLGRREADKDLSTGGTPKAKSNRVKRAGSVFLFGDGLPRADGSNWMTVPESGLNLTDSTMLDYYNSYQATWKNFDLKRHGGRMNVIYVDGHAETIFIPGKLKDVGLTRGIYD